MTKDIFNLKKEIDKIKNELILFKDKIFKNNLIIYSILTLIFISGNIFDFNIHKFIISGFVTLILENIASLIINNKEYKNKKELINNIKRKQNELNSLIQKEIEKDKSINYVNDINKKADLNTLEDFVLNNKLKNDYKYNLKKVKKRVRKR